MLIIKERFQKRKFSLYIFHSIHTNQLKMFRADQTRSHNNSKEDSQAWSQLMSPTHASRAASKFHNQLFSTNVSLYASSSSNHSHVCTIICSKKNLFLCIKHDYVESYVTEVYKIKCQ